MSHVFQEALVFLGIAGSPAFVREPEGKRLHACVNSATPRPGGIDFGQPLFWREMFDRYLNGALPFDMTVWDWHMIETFMCHGVWWHHIDRPSFLFRLATCKGRA